MNRFRIVEATLTRELAKPYAYGSADCFMLGCAFIDALAGSGTADKYRGAYRTLAGAQRALRRRGHTSLVSFFAAELGQEPKGGAEARLGDLVILRLSDGAEHVGVCLGARFVTKTERGRSDQGLADVIAAFHLG
ncbi:hypothetical protein GOC40_00375 [Sinorhizobium meliloti]|nr:hypothetical protein [Sinorhizobium meliloti]MDW9844782.1 hypothetical protein [Sinorhizobium meliloti]MDX0141876.1 hypothetical protein [Sinorhizobium meliloti]MDX0147873.1 hypothetical protein [Sinorhizobium meliloti]MDX0167079.1 hypothetical protein [Sinorhizobium meliloti]